MVKEELLKKSPLRIFDKSLHGGVGKGNIGVIASRQGIGKTACLVHIATDKLMAGKHVIHLSYAKRVDHIISWYEDIFKEISKKRSLENAMEIHDELIRNRVIMNFSQDGVGINQVLASLEAMMDNGQLDTDTVVIDGYDFTATSLDEIKAFKNFAKKKKIEFWFTDAYHREDIDGPVLNASGIPENLDPFLDFIDVIVTLKAEKDYLHLYIVKELGDLHREDLPLKLDPKTLLIVEV